MNKCPADNCGRTFESLSVLEEHLRRRHPKYLSECASGPARDTRQEQVVQEEISKLPKIRQLKLQSRDHKPVEVYRKSLSKGKPESKNVLHTSKITTVISDSRNYLETAENGDRKSKRPSLSKKGSSSDLLTNKQERLPELKSVRQKKLQILGGQASKLNKTTSYEQKDPMAMTAPNFNRLQLKETRQKSRSKEKGSQAEVLEESQVRRSQAEKMILVKTQQGFHEKQTKLHHHPRTFLKRVSDREKNVDKTEDTIASQAIEPENEKESLPATNEPKKSIQLKKEPKIKHNLKRDSSLRKSQLKPELSENVSFEQRIVVLKQTSLSRLNVPTHAKCEFLFANNCNLSLINLNNLETLRELSLQHNNLKDLAFLNYPSNLNIEKVYVDHNQLIFLDYLPPNLKVLSATFNAIEGLDNNTRELSGLCNLQEIDFTFNPIRKEPNYKLHVISACHSLQKIDGIKITKFDLQLAAEYIRMLDEELGLIPSSKFRNLVISKCSGSPSTAISAENENEPQEVGMSYQELEKEISKLTKITKQTQDNLAIIKQQNEIISQEIKDLKGREQEVSFDSEALYQKLKTECEALQLLNFLQYASEEQLQVLILKKQQQLLLA